MIARKSRVVAPVTLRIVPARPGQKSLRYGLLVCAFLLTAWLSYDYGRSQTPASDAPPFARSHASEGHITALERERDALREQLAELQWELEQQRRALEAERASIRPAPSSQDQQREARSSEPEAGPTDQVADTALRLENVQITGIGSGDVFRLAFSVTRDGDGSDRVTGTIWIAVNGTSRGKPTRLALKTLSPERRSFVTMGFEQRQEIAEELVLPEDFLPRNVLIEVKPYSSHYSGTSDSVAWLTTG